jgi:hypothetical protein
LIKGIQLAIKNDDLIDNLIKEIEKPDEEEMKRT